MNESDLTRQLRAAADEIHGRPDLAEIEHRAGSVRNRRRVTGGVLAAMLVAAAGGIGFGIGRSVADDQGEITSAAVTDESVPAEPTMPTTPPTDAPAETIAPVSDSPEPASTLPETAAADDASYSGDVAAEFRDGQQALDVVYERTLANGVRVRAQRGQAYAEPPVDGQWRPADYCWATIDGRISIDGPDVVDVGWYGWYSELFDDVQVERADLGGADARPMRVLQVQARDTVHEVAVTWADGAADRTPVVEGVAVLVVDGSAVWETDFSIEVVTADGSRTLASADLDRWSDPEFLAGCEEPPPGLPEPGEQPANADAERAAITDRFDLLWEPPVLRDDKLDLLDDWTGVADAIDAVNTGTFAEVAATAVHRIGDIVFTSPTEAWFFYDLLTDAGDFRNRYGQAFVVDGSWQFPRAMVCQDLGMGGGGCEPSVDGIYPPSYWERYGDPNCEVSSDGVVCEEGVALDSPTTVAPEG